MKANRAAAKPTELGFTLMSLVDDEERFLACVIEMYLKYLKSGAYGEDEDASVLFADCSPEMLRHVADARDGKFEPTPHFKNIIRAYAAAASSAVRMGEVVNDLKELVARINTPTLWEVKQQFVRLFIKEQRPEAFTESRWLQELKDRGEIPADTSIRKILDPCGLPWRRDKPGPRGPWKMETRRINTARRKFRN